MRVVWVPQWTVLPVIVEDRAMVEESVHRGRLPVGGQQVDPSMRNRLSESERSLSTRQFAPSSFSSRANLRFRSVEFDCSDSEPENVSPNNSPYGLNLQGATLPQHVPATNGSAHHAQHTVRGQSPGAFNMSGIAGALPDYQLGALGQLSTLDQQRLIAGTPGNASNYPTHQFPGQSSAHTGNFPTHSSQYVPAYQQGYPLHQNAQSQSGGLSPLHPSYPSGSYLTGQQQQFMYYPGHYPQAVQGHNGMFGPGTFLQQAADLPIGSGRLPQNAYPLGAPSSYGYGPSGGYLRPESMAGRL